MSYIVETLPEIGRTVGRSDQTVRKWIKIHGFPAAKAPNGKWMTTHGLIDNWILARKNQSGESYARVGKKDTLV